MDNENEGREIKEVDAENVGVESENEGVDNEVLPTEKKGHRLQNPPTINYNDGRATSPINKKNAIHKISKK